MSAKALSGSTILAVFVILAGAQVGNAATITTSSSATFAADTTGDVTGDFSSVPTPFGTCPQCFGGYNPLSGYASLQGVSFSTTNTGGNVNVDAGGYYGGPPNDPSVPYAVDSQYTGSNPDVLTITLPSPATAFALDFNTLFASTTATFTLSNGFTTNVSSTPTGSTTDFIGFLSSNPFDTITLSVPNGQSWVVTDFTTATATATPLPSTWTMLIAGFAVCGFFAYRGSKKGSAALAAA